MAEQIETQVRNNKNLKLGAGGDTTDAGEKVDTGVGSCNSDGWEGLFPVENLEKINPDRSVGVFDFHEYLNFPANTTDGCSRGGETFNGFPADEDVHIRDFLDSLLADGESLDGLFSDPIFENLDETFYNDFSAVDTNGEFHGFDGEVAGTAARRIRLQASYNVGDSNDGLGENEDSENEDTNRLDYFKVSAFDINGGDDLTGVASYGGGRRNRDVMVDPIPEQERGGGTAVASGGIRLRRLPVGISANSDGGEAVVQRLGTAIAGAGGYMTREAPVEVFSNGGNHGGEPVVQRLKREGVTVPVHVAVVVVMMMMVMLVVLMLVMVKMEVRR